MASCENVDLSTDNATQRENDSKQTIQKLKKKRTTARIPSDHSLPRDVSKYHLPHSVNELPLRSLTKDELNSHIHT